MALRSDGRTDLNVCEIWTQTIAEWRFHLPGHHSVIIKSLLKLITGAMTDRVSNTVCESRTVTRRLGKLGDIEPADRSLVGKANNGSQAKADRSHRMAKILFANFGCSPRMLIFAEAKAANFYIISS